MKREDAIQEIKTTITWLRDEVLDEQTAIMTDIALTTLAPAVRHEPPTVVEVGDDEMCWVSLFPFYWEAVTGRYARETHGDTWIAWLPYSAIPKGGA